MRAEQRCPECDAAWSTESKCLDHFHQMGLWEWEILDKQGPIPEVHYLMVLCYHLQHPSLYSPEALAWAQERLAENVEHGVGPQEVRRRFGDELGSGKRTHKITGTPDRHGTYAHPVQWTMTAADVIACGIDAYCDSVRTWARSIYGALMDSGNL